MHCNIALKIGHGKHEKLSVAISNDKFEYKSNVKHPHPGITGVSHICEDIRKAIRRK